MNSLRLFWGLVVLSIGALLIAVGEGYLDASIWTSLWAIWPVILVVIGLRFLVKNDRLLMALTLMVFLASALFVASEYQTGAPNLPAQSSESMSAIYDTGSIKKADITIVTGATRLRLSALPEGAPEEMLYKINSSQMGKIATVKTVDGDTVKLRIQESGQGYQMGQGMVGGRELEVFLPSELLLSLKVEGGATKLDMDFTNLNTGTVELAIGATDGDIILGSKSEIQNFRVEAGASNLVFSIPVGVAISAKSQGGLSNIASEPELEIVETEGEYTSKGYASSPTRVEMTVSSGLTNINFVRK